mgnify:CR=1 FL=1
MLIVVCAGQIQSISGARADGKELSDAEKTVIPIEPLPAGHLTIAIKDEALMDAVWASYDAGAKIELVKDNEDQVVSVNPLLPIEIHVPREVRVDEIVEAKAVLPGDTQDTQVTFQVEDGQAIAEDVQDGQASHAYVFVSLGTYRIQVSSANHGRAVAEVVVQ